MPRSFSTEFLSDAHLAGKEAAERLRLPFHFAVRHGMTGNWLGTGVGNSIDFQDQRPYSLGDDPRYINWAAYARSGHYTMKLYREETTPLVDLVLDCSESMFLSEEKSLRTWQLFFFVFESALRAHANVRIHALSGSNKTELSAAQVLQYQINLPAEAQPAHASPSLSEISFRRSSIRVLLSDVLYPGDPRSVLHFLSSGKGRGIILVPYCAAEASPQWRGNMLFYCCEGKTKRKQMVDEQGLNRYQELYQKHFKLWLDECRRLQFPFARFDAETSLMESLRIEALTSGAVELCN